MNFLSGDDVNIGLRKFINGEKMKKVKEVNGLECFVNLDQVELMWLKKVKEGEAPVTIMVLTSGKQIEVEGDQTKELK